MPKPPPLRILESALYAADLDAAEAFYGGVLGLERILRSGTRHVFYRCGDGVLLIFNPAETQAPAADPTLPVPPHGAEGAGQLDAWAVLLPAVGVAIEADFRWPNGARSIYVRDPAGNSVEFAEPGLWGLSAEDEAREWLDAPATGRELL